MNKANKHYGTAITVIALLMVVIITLAVVFPRIMAGGDETVSVRVPLIVTTLTSADGEPHTIQSVFDVRMNRRDNRDIKTEALHNALAEIMSEMDYADISAPDGIDYINRQATAALKDYFPALTGDTTAYVYDFIIGNHILFTEPPKQNDVMKGLFQNME